MGVQKLTLADYCKYMFVVQYCTMKNLLLLQFNDNELLISNMPFYSFFYFLLFSLSYGNIYFIYYIIYYIVSVLGEGKMGDEIIVGK